nr:thiamine pyrophosphate-binding protein [Candidatus Njordarchaeum guaymaensis]
MVSTKGNKAIVDALVRNNVEYVFGVCGTSVAGFLSALSKESSIKYVVARHERGAGSMADGYARAGGKVGVCQMHSGPGTLNGVLSIADAYRDSSPVVLLAGQVNRNLIGREIFGEANQFGVLKPYTKSCERIERVEDIPRIIGHAFYLARSGRPGPVLVEMPEDMYNDVGDIDPAPLVEEIESPTITSPLEILTEATERLLSADRPVILCGGGVVWSSASEQVKILAERLQIPVTTTQNGRGVFPEDHPLALGVGGWYGGNSAADEALEEADVILGVGCTFSSLTTYNFTSPIKAETIQINIDPWALGKNIQYRYGIVGDARAVLSKMNKIMESKGTKNRSSAWLDRIRRKKETWSKLAFSDKDLDKVPIKPQRLIQDIQKAIPRSSIVVGGAGLHHVFLVAYTRIIYPRTFISSVNIGSMGFAFPAAIGAKAAKPEETVLCVVGDGDFMMTIQDLETAVRCCFNVVTVIVNNNCYLAPKMFQKTTFGTEFGSDYSNPDFAKVAQNFGAHGIRVERPGEIVDSIKNALDCGKPAVIDVQVDSTVYPPMNIKAAMRLREVGAKKART